MVKIMLCWLWWWACLTTIRAWDLWLVSWGWADFAELTVYLQKWDTWQGIIMKSAASQFGPACLLMQSVILRKQSIKKIGKATSAFNSNHQTENKKSVKEAFVRERNWGPLWSVSGWCWPCWDRNFLKGQQLYWKRPVWCWHGLGACSVKDSSFRVWQNCEEGLSWGNEMKRTHETTEK